MEIPARDIVLKKYRGRRPFMQAGKAYHGIGYLGYDRLKGIFEHTWLHDDSTRMYYSSGRYDTEQRTITLHGSWRL